MISNIAFRDGDRNISQVEYLEYQDQGSDFSWPWHCAMCPTNSFKAAHSNERCTPCPHQNTWTRIGAESEEECRCDFGYTGERTECTPCLPGTYKPYPGPYTCLDCPADHYGAGSAQTSEADGCLPCPSNSSSAAASSSIHACACDRGFYGRPETNGSSTSLACQACEVGKFGPDTNASECQDCPQHEVSLLPAQTECICDKGHFRPFSLVYSLDCEPCEEDMYKDTFGDEETQCKSCPANSYTIDPAGPQSFEEWEDFVLLNGARDVSACHCAPGFYSATLENGGECLECPSGVKTTFGPQACDACPQGRIPNKDAAYFPRTQCGCACVCVCVCVRARRRVRHKSKLSYKHRRVYKHTHTGAM